MVLVAEDDVLVRNLINTDVVMPRMDGLKLAARIREERPGVCPRCWFPVS